MIRKQSIQPEKELIASGYSRALTVAFLAVLTAAPDLAADEKAASANCATEAACCQATPTACCADSARAAARQVELQVAGMTSATCESKVKDALAKIQGVRESSACAESKKVAIAYDSAKVRDKDLLAAIRKAGFKVEFATVELNVEGMNCADCASKVDAAIAKLKGVREHNVCHQAHHAVVTFDPQKLSREKLTAAIDASGFKVLN